MNKSLPVEPEYVERTVRVCKNCNAYPCLCNFEIEHPEAAPAQTEQIPAATLLSNAEIDGMALDHEGCVYLTQTEWQKVSAQAKIGVRVGEPVAEYICKCGLRVTPHRCNTGKEF